VSKIKNIFEGWSNVVFPNSSVEKIANLRSRICDLCIHKGNKLGVDYCKKCGCPIIAKSRSMEEHCPLNKW
jgi:hypothetical protein